MHLSTLKLRCKQKVVLLTCRPMELANLIGFLCNSRLFCHFALLSPTHGNSRTKPSPDGLGLRKSSKITMHFRRVWFSNMGCSWIYWISMLSLAALGRLKVTPSPVRAARQKAPRRNAKWLHPSVLGYVAKDFLNGISRHQSRVTRLDKNVIITSTQKNFLKMCLHCDVCCYL